MPMMVDDNDVDLFIIYCVPGIGLSTLREPLIYASPFEVVVTILLIKNLKAVEPKQLLQSQIQIPSKEQSQNLNPGLTNSNPFSYS